MQEKTPRDRRTPYTGRFADPNSGARKSGFKPARPRAASDAPSRPSGFAAAEPVKPRPAASPKPDEGDKSDKTEKKIGLSKLLRKGGDEAPEKPGKIRNKRSQAIRLSWWEKLLIGVIVIALLILILALIFGGDAKPRHQMPRIERGGDSAYSPEDGAQLDPDATATVDYSQYLVTPTPEAGAQGDLSGGLDLSQYLVTPQPGQNLSDAAAAAGAGYDAAGGADGAGE